jgi:hypothetical protein
MQDPAGQMQPAAADGGDGQLAIAERQHRPVHDLHPQGEPIQLPAQPVLMVLQKGLHMCGRHPRRQRQRRRRRAPRPPDAEHHPPRPRVVAQMHLDRRLPDAQPPGHPRGVSPRPAGGARR